jgi:hypothetical protein
MREYEEKIISMKSEIDVLNTKNVMTNTFIKNEQSFIGANASILSSPGDQNI